jgi:hypothetical protein
MHERVKMFLWRLDNNVLLLKSNLARRLGITDTKCPICNATIENERHLFFDCPLAYAIWFDVNWSMRSDAIQIANSQEILNWVLDPPLSRLDACMKSHCSLVWALTLETIWNLRNKALHGNELPQLPTIVRGLEHRVYEFKNLRSSNPKGDSPRDTAVWRPPPSGVMKLNCDAAVSRARTTLAEVARNDKGEILKIWAKADCIEDPGVAETKAILFAFQMALEEDYHQALVEGDAKVVIDTLLKPSSQGDWTISTIVGDIRHLARCFLNCNFAWTRRDGNNLAHSVAKFTSSSSYFLCNSENIPQVLLNVWRLDVLSS